MLNYYNILVHTYVGTFALGLQPRLKGHDFGVGIESKGFESTMKLDFCQSASNM
jgi:hypothetical protein